MDSYHAEYKHDSHSHNKDNAGVGKARLGKDLGNGKARDKNFDGKNKKALPQWTQPRETPTKTARHP